MTATVIPWARIMAPMAGAPADLGALNAAAMLAAPFEAELAAIYAPADVADLMPWMGDGFMGGVQVAAFESLREAGEEGRQAAEAAFRKCAYGRKTFISLSSPVWSALSMHSRLSDVVVFDGAAAKGQGPLAEAFRQMIAAEQRPVVVARNGFDPAGVMAVAWDGGKEASRAMRTALPLLQRASAVHVLSCCASSPRMFEPTAVAAFLAARGVTASITLVDGGGDVGPALIKAAKGLGANLFVAGAYGHPRLQEFIFGSATRSFLHADDGPSLFLSH